MIRHRPIFFLTRCMLPCAFQYLCWQGQGEQAFFPSGIEQNSMFRIQGLVRHLIPRHYDIHEPVFQTQVGIPF